MEQEHGFRGFRHDQMYTRMETFGLETRAHRVEASEELV